MWTDLRYALRLLLKAPGFSLLTLLTLAAGLAFAIYMAAAIHAIALTRLPWPSFDRLVVIKETYDGRENGSEIRYSDFVEYSKAQTRFEHLYPTQRNRVAIGGKRYPENFVAARLTAGSWALHGVQPLLGRKLEAGDELSGAAPVMVIGADLWQQHFAKDPAIIGSQIKVDGVTTTIVGVMPAGFRFPISEQLWLPFAAPKHFAPGDDNRVTILARLKPAVDITEAGADISVIAQRLAASWPKTNKVIGAMVVPFVQSPTQGVSTMYLTLGGAAGLLLLLVWINAGNLLLARASERQQETAIRSALGAPRHRLLRHMLAEGLLLSVGACLVGLFFAAWALAATNQVLLAMPSAPEAPFWLQFGLSLPIVLVAMGLTLVSTLVIGLLPAWRNARTDLMMVLRDGTRHGQGRAAGRLSGSLVVIQIAVSSMLLVAACVLTYAMYQTLHADYGCRVKDVATARLGDRNGISGYRDKVAREQLFQRLDTALRSLPGQPHFALTNALPGDGRTEGTLIQPEGHAITDDRYPNAGLYSVNSTYFAALEIPILSGRALNDQDRADTLKVAVVDTAFANRHWPGVSPLGKRFRINAAEPDGEWITVVGVSRPVVQGSPSGGDDSVQTNVYRPLRQSVPDTLRIALVGGGDMASTLALLRQAISRADANLAPTELFSFEQLHEDNTGGLDLMGAWFVALGLISLLLAVSGIYGITARAVTLRTHEVGVRRAIGATDGAIVWLLLRRGVRQLLIGLPLGMLLGWGVTTAMAELLYQVGLAVPLAMLLVSLLISAVILLATLIPARRAIALIPSAALRYE
ncbi:ADOP family duplicated permease [Chitinimonas viridis]|uniref:ADOP family duplicated permease n=1 Tax=Chitinimonas viridis TaxID=664880 RepID=A0ABT8B196_9NEIS|nr:ADOP family duplicated permease [Chitinimonas viridis]MDN3575637.1 ADOP family duplicated permease [Chitinimonas viridis]